MDKLAIVILNWNGEEMLKKYLPAVMQYSREEAQIYVADNASTDGSLNLLAQGFPECNIIRLERNWGFAEGYNKALRQVDAEYYLLLNSDIEVTHHWLTPSSSSWMPILRWRHVSPSCFLFSTRICLSMQGRVGIPRPLRLSFLPRAYLRHRGT